MAGLSPMMEQYFQIKKEYADTLLFFRLGDFYEMFFDDAKIASKELELVLTGRDCGQEERAPMCGVPFHSADTYIAKLVSRGYKVAICEQVEDPATAKGIVKRDVVRIVTPGTVIESSMLDEGKNNFLASVYITDKSCGAAFVDVSTGEVHLDSFNDTSDAARLMNQLGCFDPSEVLLNKYASSIKEIVNFVKDRLSARYQILSDDDYNETLCKNAVVSHIDENSEDFAEFNRNNALLLAFGSALNYLENAQKTKLENINEVEFFGADKFLNLDLTARRNLELTETQIRREKKGSLLWVLDGRGNRRRHHQQQPRDRLHRLRHLRQTLLRTPHPRGRPERHRGRGCRRCRLPVRRTDQCQPRIGPREGPRGNQDQDPRNQTRRHGSRRGQEEVLQAHGRPQHRTAQVRNRILLRGGQVHRGGHRIPRTRQTLVRPRRTCDGDRLLHR